MNLPSHRNWPINGYMTQFKPRKRHKDAGELQKRRLSVFPRVASQVAFAASRLEGSGQNADGHSVGAREGNVRLRSITWKAQGSGRNKIFSDITGLLDPASPEAANFVFFQNCMSPSTFLASIFCYLLLKHPLLIFPVSASESTESPSNVGRKGEALTQS